MKTWFVLLFVCTVHLNASNLYSQQKKMDISMKNASLVDVFRYIRQNSDYTFVYDSDAVKQMKTISLDMKNVAIEEILEQCFKGSPFVYLIEGNLVIIKEQKEEQKQVKGIRVKGFVFDTKKQPMPGVTVKVVGLPVGTATNEKGWFAIDLPMQKGALEFSFVGFKKKQIEFTEKVDTLRIILEEDVSDLDEVQVIAYGERKKRDVVSAISSVTSKDIKEIPAASFTSLLQGRMAGVQIVNRSGSPGGGGTKMYVRGYNSLMVSGASDGQPLFVIDGVPMHSFTSPITGANTLAELDPNSIESIEVLKDAASAALYGSRAGNGVVLITTKKGKVGQAQFQANLSYTASIMPKFPLQLGGREERRLHDIMMRHTQRAAYDFKTSQSIYPTDYTSAYQIGLDAIYDKWWGNGQKKSAQSIPLLQDSLNPFYNNQSNWWKQFFRTGKVINANIQASGGSERMRYMVGMGYYTENGINYGSDFKRATFVANLALRPAKRITFDTRLNLGYANKSRNTKNNTFADSPNIEQMTADPRLTSSLLPLGGAVEDEVLKQLNGTVDKNDSYRLMFNGVLGVDLVKGLKFTTSLGLDLAQTNSNVFEPSYLDYQGSNKSTGQIERNISITQENILRYTRSFNEIHNLEVLVGTSFTEMQSHRIQGYGKRIGSDGIYYVGVDAPELYDFGAGIGPEALQKFLSNYTQQRMMSYLGRVAYNYKSKYLLEATYRRDGSSTFGENVRWANFPSVAVGWTFSEEPFMAAFPWLSMGKIRASWGTSGRILIDPYIAHGVMKPGDSFNGNQGMSADIINLDISWEQSDQYDIGLDIDLFNYRLKFKMDYYYKLTKDLLYEVELPGNMFNNDKMWQNAMEVSNEGLELELIADIFRESAVSWRTKFNISRNWNFFRKRYSGTDVDDLVIGRPLQGLYLFKEDGFVQNQDEVPAYSLPDGSKQYLQTEDFGQYYLPGMRKYIDIDGDGVIYSTDDQYYAFSTFPKVYGGWTHELMWKGFTLNVHFSYE